MTQNDKHYETVHIGRGRYAKHIPNTVNGYSKGFWVLSCRSHFSIFKQNQCNHRHTEVHRICNHPDSCPVSSGKWKKERNIDDTDEDEGEEEEDEKKLSAIHLHIFHKEKCIAGTVLTVVGSIKWSESGFAAWCNTALDINRDRAHKSRFAQTQRVAVASASSPLSLPSSEMHLIHVRNGLCRFPWGLRWLRFGDNCSRCGISNTRCNLYNLRKKQPISKYKYSSGMVTLACTIARPWKTI